MESLKPLDPNAMPGPVRLARVLTFVASALVGLVGVLYLGLALGDTAELERDYGVSPGALAVLGAIMLAHGAAGIALASKFATGGVSVRTGGLVWAGLGIAVGLGTAPLGLLIIVLATLVGVNLFRQPARAWFGRSRP